MIPPRNQIRHVARWIHRKNRTASRPPQFRPGVWEPHAGTEETGWGRAKHLMDRRMISRPGPRLRMGFKPPPMRREAAAGPTAYDNRGPPVRPHASRRAGSMRFPLGSRPIGRVRPFGVSAMSSHARHGVCRCRWSACRPCVTPKGFRRFVFLGLGMRRRSGRDSLRLGPPMACRRRSRSCPRTSRRRFAGRADTRTRSRHP